MNLIISLLSINEIISIFNLYFSIKPDFFQIASMKPSDLWLSFIVTSFPTAKAFIIGIIDMINGSL